MTKPVTASPGQPLSVEERISRGKAARAMVPRTTHGEWTAPADREDPIVLLERQAATRVPDLVPLRYGRMAASPFSYFRGAALPMATDLGATTPVGIDVQLCGDAHLSNFGGFAAPDRTLVFDVNDFDETNPGPFEWDVKRMAASFEIAARSLNLNEKVRRRLVATSVRSYREAMRRFAKMGNLDLWYARFDVDAEVARLGKEVGSKGRKRLDKNVTKARSKDRLKAAAKLTRQVDGRLEFVSDPPLLVPIEELFSDTATDLLDKSIHDALRSYRRSLSHDRKLLLESYRYVCVARKVVGVGSVGTRAWVVLFTGRDEGDPLILQVKEAEASVLEEQTARSQFATHGQRVVEGQRLMQAASDIFLGYEQITDPDGVTRDYYMRQLWDWKASADIESMTDEGLSIYAQMCGGSLARAHARSGDRIAIASYLGGGISFDRALTDFAVAYADQNDRDYAALVAAVVEGRVKAETGI